MLLRSGRDANSPSSASCASRPADPEPLIARLPGARKPVAEVIRGRQKRPEQGRAGLVGKVRFVLEDRASRVHHVVRVVPVLRPHARRRREQPCGRGQEEETVAQPFPPGRLANAGASTRGRSLREGGLARVLQLGEYGNRKHCVPGGQPHAHPRNRVAERGLKAGRACRPPHANKLPTIARAILSVGTRRVAFSLYLGNAACGERRQPRSDWQELTLLPSRYWRRPASNLHAE